MSFTALHLLLYLSYFCSKLFVVCVLADMHFIFYVKHLESRCCFAS